MAGVVVGGRCHGPIRGLEGIRTGGRLRLEPGTRTGTGEVVAVTRHSAVIGLP